MEVDRYLKLAELINAYGKWEKEQQRTIPNENEVTLNNYIGQKNRITDAMEKYKLHRTNLDRKRRNKKGIAEEQRNIEKIWNNIAKVDRSCCGVKIEYNNNKIEGWGKLLDELDTRIKNLKEQQPSPQKVAEEAKNNADRIQKIISNSKFSIIKVERTKQ